MRLLLVEDYRPLLDSLARGLGEAGYAVDTAATGTNGLWLATSNNYDVIVLDLMLPGLDGLSVLKKLRGKGNRASVLILTARDGVDDRVAGLDLGADDYLVKPFAFEELLARVRALVRRRYEQHDPHIRVADLVIDTAAQTVSRAGRAVELSAREYALLEFLAMRANQIVSRSDIWEHLYAFHEDAHSNVVDVYVGYLRRKIEESGQPPLLHTHRGRGYRLGTDAP